MFSRSARHSHNASSHPPGNGLHMPGSAAQNCFSIAGCMHPAAVQWSVVVAGSDEHIDPASPRHVK